VVAPASNRRWASDGFEIPCWNGEAVRVAFAIDTHDREIVAWVATSGGGISGEMIHHMMLDCVERRDTVGEVTGSACGGGGVEGSFTPEVPCVAPPPAAAPACA
jgi:hypothetical protein